MKRYMERIKYKPHDSRSKAKSESRMKQPLAVGLKRQRTHQKNIGKRRREKDRKNAAREQKAWRGKP